MIHVNYYAIRPAVPKTISVKHCRVEIMAFSFVLFHRDRFSISNCLFRQRFSSAYLLKLFLLPQCVHTTDFIRCDTPELTCWCLCSLHADIQMSPGEVVGFPKNAALSFCRNMKSAAHVPCAGWLILFCSAPACTHDFKNFLSSIQVFCCKTFTVLWYDASYRCLCVQSSMSSPLHHFSYRRLSVLLCLQAPVSFSSCFCTSFSDAPFRIASLRYY